MTAGPSIGGSFASASSKPSNGNDPSSGERNPARMA